MANPISKYAFELWSKAGLRTASLTPIAKDRQITQSLNEADDITWTMPLKLFQAYARKRKVDPKVLLQNRSTEVRVKRGQNYVAGGEVYHYNVVSTAQEAMLKVRATGFLNFFKDAFTDDPQTYTAENGADIAWDLIDHWQTQGANFDFGVTQGSIPTTGDHDITYHYTNIKDALQALTRRVNGPFDIEITPEKVFNAYVHKGSVKPSIVFRHPGNILDYDIPSEGGELANRILVFGAGISTDAAPPVIRNDTASQGNYLVRAKKITPSDVSETDTLESKGDTELAIFATPFEIPTITVNGNKAPYVTDYEVGDTVQLIIQSEPFIAQAGQYRIYKRVITIDEQDSEKVQLYLGI